MLAIFVYLIKKKIGDRKIFFVQQLQSCHGLVQPIIKLVVDTSLISAGSTIFRHVRRSLSRSFLL